MFVRNESMIECKSCNNRSIVASPVEIEEREQCIRDAASVTLVRNGFNYRPSKNVRFVGVHCQLI